MNARRVRILDLEVIEDPASFDDYLQLEGLTMAALRDSYPHLPLFLNASALRMDVEGCWLGLGLHFNVMTSPRGLQELDIGSDGHGDVATVSRILRSPHSQALQKLKLWMIFSSSNGQPASSKDIAELAASIASIGTLRRLKFHCDDGSSAAWLVALVSHPNLEDLDTGPFPGTYSITPSLNKPLRSLQRLRLGNEFGRPIRLDQLDPHTSFLSALSSCPLRELSIEIDMTTSDDSHRAPRLQELLSAISCLKTLEHLAVFSDVDQYSVPGAVLSSLFSIRTLRVVKMDTIPLRLDGGAVRQMASSWRDIEHLSLGPDVPYKDPTMISVHDLSPFANHCPRLETLQMQIIETQTQRPAERTTAQTLLRTLFFGQSRVPEGDLQAIASFVDEVFPETYVSFSDPGTTFQLLALIDELSWRYDPCCCETTSG